jgi:futalosine hydrolase
MRAERALRVLVVAATHAEVQRLASGARERHHVDLLVTGVGMVATAAHASRALALTRYDVAFNFGVCGSFDRSLSPGTVVHVTCDALSELGAEDGERFISMEELGLVPSTWILNPSPPANQVLAMLPSVTGITVNTVHGHDPSIEAIRRRLQPQVESMEGAAFAHACSMSGVPYAQVRAVSNVVERRNRRAWQLDSAIQNLNATALSILDTLCR